MSDGTSLLDMASNDACSSGAPSNRASEPVVVSPGSQVDESERQQSPQPPIGLSTHGAQESENVSQIGARPSGHQESQEAVDLDSAMRELELEYEATESAMQHDQDAEDQPARDALHEILHGPAAAADAPKASSAKPSSPSTETSDPLAFDLPLLGSPQDPLSLNEKQASHHEPDQAQDHVEEPLLSDSFHPLPPPAMSREATSAGRDAHSGALRDSPQGSVESSPQQARAEGSGAVGGLFGGLETEEAEGGGMDRRSFAHAPPGTASSEAGREGEREDAEPGSFAHDPPGAASSSTAGGGEEEDCKDAARRLFSFDPPVAASSRGSRGDAFGTQHDTSLKSGSVKSSADPLPLSHPVC
jgi:hypothetical protein